MGGWDKFTEKKGKNMNQEDWKKIQKGNTAFLTDEFLRQSWFICYHITENANIGAVLLINSWKQVISFIQKAKKAPTQNFSDLLYTEILKNSLQEIKAEDKYKSIQAPKITVTYKIFENAIAALENSPLEKAIYLISTLTNLNERSVADIVNKSESEIKDICSDCYKNVLNAKKNMSGVEFSTLYTKFKSSDKKAFRSIELSDFLVKSVLHSTGGSKKTTEKVVSTSNFKTTTQKEKKFMQSSNMDKKKKKKLIKRIIAGVIALIVVVAAVIGIKKFLSIQTGEESTITTTYTAEAVTSGTIDQTISGSGNLTPVDNETLSCAYDCTVDTINVEAGDTVEEGDIIAVVTAQVPDTETSSDTMYPSGSTNTTYTEKSINIKAGCDGIITEIAVEEGAEVTAGSEIGLLMGTDAGFYLNISVGEDEISDVEKGQEVTFSVDTQDEEFTGEVTGISYNGQTNNSSVSYQIQVQMVYVEGIYPGMSCSADIVIESSDEGLIVPVSAIKTSGDTSYVYLAPSGAEDGTDYDSEEYTLDDFEKVEVETDTSDGTNILISSGDLSEGDYVISISMTSSEDGSLDDSSSQFGGMPNMGGGDFDFSSMGDFDPSNMPQGGGGFGGGQMGQ